MTNSVVLIAPIEAGRRDVPDTARNIGVVVGNGEGDSYSVKTSIGTNDYPVESLHALGYVNDGSEEAFLSAVMDPKIRGVVNTLVALAVKAVRTGEIFRDRVDP